MKAPGLLFSIAVLTGFAQQPETPLFRLVDVNQGEPTDVSITDLIDRERVSAAGARSRDGER